MGQRKELRKGRKGVGTQSTCGRYIRPDFPIDSISLHGLSGPFPCLYDRANASSPMTTYIQHGFSGCAWPAILLSSLSSSFNHTEQEQDQNWVYIFRVPSPESTGKGGEGRTAWNFGLGQFWGHPIIWS